MALVLAPAAATPAALGGQSLLERSPNVEGVWGSPSGTLHFHFLHRFWVTDPPTRKVINTPTFLLGASVPGGVLLGGRYASNSQLVPGSPNEWELFARWAALPPGGGPADVAVQGGWNGTAESVDGELVVGGEVGRARLLAGARGFTAFRGASEGRAAWLAGARFRVSRHVALAGDAARVLGDDSPDLAWSAGLQLAIPYTPHTLSLHASNANTTTLQGASVGLDQRLWGFEFTVPITLSRYFGRSARAAPPPSDGPPDVASGGGAEVVVEMDNRLQFLPDTVRLRRGEEVVWRNTSDIIHTVTADPSRAASEASVRLPAGAEPFDSGEMVPGSEFRHRFDAPGTYVYFCVPHELAGMVGVVVVEP